MASITSTKARGWNYKKSETIAGYGFITPAVLAILVFLIIPILMSIALVFRNTICLPHQFSWGFQISPKFSRTPAWQILT